MTRADLQTFIVKASYQTALSALKYLATRMETKESEGYSAMRLARERVVNAAGGTIPGDEIDKDIAAALAGSEWEDCEGKIAKYSVPFHIAVLSAAYENRGRFEIGFQYMISGTRTAQHAFAWVTPNGEEWALVTDHNSWLHSHRDRHGLSDAEIDLVHANVTEWWLGSDYRFRDGRTSEV